MYNVYIMLGYFDKFHINTTIAFNTNLRMQKCPAARQWLV